MRPFLANCPNHEDGLRSARPASTASASRAADRLPKGPRRLPTAFVEARGDLDGVVLRAPGDHLLRKLDALLDLDLVRKQLEPFYSEMGRPSVDPELMIRMLLIGYCYSIRSARRLCDEVRFNLAYRWFCGLGLEADRRQKRCRRLIRRRPGPRAGATSCSSPTVSITWSIS